MKKKEILVLPAIQNLKEIAEGLSSQLNITKAKYSQVEFQFNNGYANVKVAGKDFKDFDYAWVSSFWKTRDLAYAIKIYLDHHQVKHTFIEQSTSKITDQLIFALNGINTPNSFYIETKEITPHLDTIDRICGYPLIVKDIRGMRGDSSKLSECKACLLECIQKLPRHRRFQFQSFIPNDYDWGIMVANGKVVSAEKSYHSLTGFLNNACNGSKEVFVDVAEVPEDIKQMAIKASKALNLTWSRADILIDKRDQKASLLEVNRFPGTTSKSTEITGARSFLKNIVKDT